MSTKKPEQMQLYTIRLQPAIIKRLHALAKKQGVTHAEVARNALAKAVMNGRLTLPTTAMHVAGRRLSWSAKAER